MGMGYVAVGEDDRRCVRGEHGVEFGLGQDRDAVGIVRTGQHRG